MGVSDTNTASINKCCFCYSDEQLADSIVVRTDIHGWKRMRDLSDKFLISSKPTLMAVCQTTPLPSKTMGVTHRRTRTLPRSARSLTSSGRTTMATPEAGTTTRCMHTESTTTTWAVVMAHTMRQRTRSTLKTSRQRGETRRSCTAMPQRATLQTRPLAGEHGGSG